MKVRDFKNGFTLTEILVVIFIISLLSGIVFANYRQGGKMMALQRAASKLAQDIRRAQEMAIAAVECSTGTCAGQIPPGYGIYLSALPFFNDRYILYADTGLLSRRYDQWDTEIERNFFEKGIIFTSPIPWVSINFEPPDPLITIRAPAQVASTTLILQLNSLTKQLEVNEFGLIEVK
jgi:prepilin-type N-terminal cleavage/methylation domain-containing protein